MSDSPFLGGFLGAIVGTGLMGIVVGIVTTATRDDPPKPFVLDAEALNKQLALLGMTGEDFRVDRWVQEDHCPDGTTGLEAYVRSPTVTYARIELCVWPNGRFTVVW